MTEIKSANIVNKPNGSGFGRIIKATHCSFKGMRAAWQYESAFRQELIMAIVLRACNRFCVTAII
jgi:diacylglycerol kinase (ATP)